MDGTLAIIGSGRMGEALLRGLLGTGTLRPEQVVCTDALPERCRQLEQAHGVSSTTDNRAAIDRADVILLALKPQVLLTELRSLADGIRPEQLVISIAAGLTTSSLEQALGGLAPVVRVMPNTPALVDEAMSVISPGRRATESHLERTEELLAPIGRVLRLPEDQLDAVTAVSGSGPAYVFLLAEAMIDAGVLLGLPRDAARMLVAQTLRGSATMVRDSGSSPTELKEMVTSPGGTTIAALRELEAGGLRSAVFDALDAAATRSRELGGR